MRITLKKIAYFVRDCFLIVAITFMIIFGCLYVKSIKSELTNIKERQQELYDNDIAQYNATIKEMDSSIFVLFANEVKLKDTINKVIAIAKNGDNNLAKRLEAIATELNIRTVGLKREIETKTKRPSYEYMKSITTVNIAHALNAKEYFIGTGVIVKITKNFTYILTNRHVVEGCPKDYECIILTDDDIYPVEVVKISVNDYDLALIRVEGTIPTKRAVRGIAEVTYQDKVFMVGNGTGGYYLYSEGTVAGYDENSDNILIVGMPSSPGNSGSAILNQNGELVGLLYAGQIVGESPFYTLDLTHGLCVNSKVLKLFLADIL